LTLRWNQKDIPSFIGQSQARSKKNAKQKALTNLIDKLISEGHIARGFRE